MDLRRPPDRDPLHRPCPVLANIVAVSGGIAARTAPALLPRTL